MSNQKIVGISFPKTMLEQLDTIREDIPRSRYIQRLLEKHLHIEDKNKK